MVARLEYMLRANFTLYLLVWSSFQPLVWANRPPARLGTCNGASGACSAAVHDYGPSLMQMKSRLGVSSRIQAAFHRRMKDAKDKCVICTEIEKEVQRQVSVQVAKEVETAKTIIEKEIMRQLLLRHNSTMKELEKVVEQQISQDLENENKIQNLEDKLEENFVENGVVTKLTTRLDTIEKRLTTLETEMKEVTSVIKDINTDVADLRAQTNGFVNATKENISSMTTLIKESTKKAELEVLSQVVILIQNTTSHFSESILQKTEERITQSVSQTLVKVERIIQEAIEREKEAHESDHAEVKEKIDENWEKIEVIIKELRNAIDEGTKAQVTNAQEITSLKESIEGIAIAAAKKVVGEHSKETQNTIKDLQDRLEDLTITVEEEAEAAMQRDEDIVSLAKLMQESEMKMVAKTQEHIKKEVGLLKSGTEKAMKKLELDIANIKSSAPEEKAKLDKIMNELGKVKATVSAEQKERMKNSDSIALLKTDAQSLKLVISEVKTDLAVHKESSHKQTLEEVRILMEEAQSSTIQKAKELSIKEMMTEITNVKLSVETQLKTSLTIIKKGQHREKEEHEAHRKKMAKKIKALKKQVSANTQVAEKAKADQKQLNDAVDSLADAVEQGEEQHKHTAEEIEKLNGMIEGMVGAMDAQKDKFPSKEDIAKLEGIITKVNAKVIGLGDKIDKETALRETSVLALEERVTANEDHLSEIEEEIIGMSEDIVGIAEIIKEISNEQDQVADKAVQEALKAVKGMVKETTSSLIEENMEKVKSETTEMISQVEKTITVLQKAIQAEQGKREKADEQINVLRQKVVSLTNSLDQKADAATVEEISKSVSLIISVIRTHKQAQSSSETEMTMIKQAMMLLAKRVLLKEKEIKHTKEIHQVHHVHHVHKVESTERITAVSKRVLEVEAAASAQISKLSTYITEVKAKLQTDGAARLKSDAALTILQEQTMSLFKKVATNSDKVSALDSKITERIESLASMLNEISIKMQVSEQSSEQDLTRMDKMLQSLATELSAEESARKVGDTRMESAIMARVQLLIEELVAVQQKNAISSSQKTSETNCVCNTITENGVSKTKCMRDGKAVASCGTGDWKPSIAGGGSSSSETKTVDISKGTSSSSKKTEGGSSSTSSSSCRCETTLKNGEFKTVCTKDGKKVPKSECNIEGAPSLDDLLKKGGSSSSSTKTVGGSSSSSKKTEGGSSSSSSSSSSKKTVGGSSSSSKKTKGGSSSSSSSSSTTSSKKIEGGSSKKTEGGSSSTSSSSCRCETTLANGEFKTVCTKDGKEVPKSECNVEGAPSLDDLLKKGGSSSSSTKTVGGSSSWSKKTEGGEPNWDDLLKKDSTTGGEPNWKDLLKK